VTATLPVRKLRKGEKELPSRRGDASKPLGDGINDFLILGPETSPFQVIDILRRSL
jgi:hypothetical protein